MKVAKEKKEGGMADQGGGGGGMKLVMRWKTAWVEESYLLFSVGEERGRGQRAHILCNCRENTARS